MGQYRAMPYRRGTGMSANSRCDGRAAEQHACTEVPPVPMFRPVRSVAFVGQPEYFRCMYEHDLDTRYEVREFLLRWGQGVDSYRALLLYDPDIAFFFRPECYPQELLDGLRGLKVALSSEPIPKHVAGRVVSSDDMRARLDSLAGARGRYDYFFHYDKTSIRFLLEQGFSVDGEFLFPVATGLYRPLEGEKFWDWGFFGRDTPHRDAFLGPARRDYNGLQVVHGVYGERFVRLMNECKIGLNLHVDGNLSLEHRMHNMMACGVMVMSEPLSHNDLLRPGVHYVEFTEPEEFFRKFQYYLEHEEERNAIAARGLALVRERLSADRSFGRLIDYVTHRQLQAFPFRCSEPSLSGSPGAAAQATAYSFARLDWALRQEVPSDALDRWRGWVNRCMPRGTRRRSLYQGSVQWIKRRLGTDGRSLGELLRQWRRGKQSSANRPATADRGSPAAAACLSMARPAPRGKRSLRALLADAAARQGLPDGAPTMAILLPSQAISGGTMVVCAHANRLLEHGYNVVLVDNGRDPYKLDWFQGLRVPVVPFQRLHFDEFVDVVMATHWSTAWTAVDFPARRHLYFVQSDETRFNPIDSVETRLARETYTMDFEFVVIAQWLKTWLREKFGKPAHYVPNAVNHAIFYPDQPLKPKTGRLRVLLEGPIDVPFKGMADAFRAVDGVDCEVWCVSSSGKPRRGWRCDRFFHRVPFAEMRRIYSSCDVLLKMSRVEGFYLPPLEMMACGGTVVTGKVTGYDEYILDGQNGLVVEQGDVDGARGCLEGLIRDRSLLNRLKQHGRQTAAAWQWDRSHTALLEVLQSQGQAGNSRLVRQQDAA